MLFVSLVYAHTSTTVSYTLSLHDALPHPLDGAVGDECVRVLREAGEHRAEAEEPDREEQELLLVEEVGELAEDRGARRRGEQRRSDDPRVLQLGAAEVGDDDGQRVADDGSGQHGDEQREQEAGEHPHDLAVPGLLDGGAAGAAEAAGGAVGAQHQRLTSWAASSRRTTVPRTSVRPATSSSGQSARTASRWRRRRSRTVARASSPRGVSRMRAARASAGSWRRSTRPSCSSGLT